MERMPITTSNNHCLLKNHRSSSVFKPTNIWWLRGTQFRSIYHFEWSDPMVISDGQLVTIYLHIMASRWQGLHLASTQDSKLSHEIEVIGQPVHWDSTQSMKVHSIQKEATRRVNVLSNAKNIIGIAKLLYRKNQITQKMTNNRLIKQTAGKPCRNSKCYILL